MRRPALITACAALAAGIACAAAARAWPARPQLPPVRVEMRGGHFAPRSIALAPGQRLVLANAGTDVDYHPYTAGAPDLDAGAIAPGASATVSFDRPGTFKVLCGIHPGMHLAVAVRTPPEQEPAR